MLLFVNLFILFISNSPIIILLSLLPHLVLYTLWFCSIFVSFTQPFVSPHVIFLLSPAFSLFLLDNLVSLRDVLLSYVPFYSTGYIFLSCQWRWDANKLTWTFDYKPILFFLSQTFSFLSSFFNAHYPHSSLSCPQSLFSRVSFFLWCERIIVSTINSPIVHWNFAHGSGINVWILLTPNWAVWTPAGTQPGHPHTPTFIHTVWSLAETQ